MMMFRMMLLLSLLLLTNAYEMNPRPLPVKTKAGSDTAIVKGDKQRLRILKKEEDEPPEETDSPTAVPTEPKRTKFPTMAPTTLAPTVLPTALPTALPTGLPTVPPKARGPTRGPHSSPPSPKPTILPTFNNNVETSPVALSPFAVIIGDSVNEIEPTELRRALQTYLVDNMQNIYDNLLYVQLEALTRRVLQQTTQTTFRYTGKAVFRGPTNATDTTIRALQQNLLEDTDALQTHLSETLTNVTVVGVELLEDDDKDTDDGSSSSSGIGGLSWVVFGAVVAGTVVALACIVCLIFYRSRRGAPPPPPTVTTKTFSPYGDMNDDPTDEHNDDFSNSRNLVVDSGKMENKLSPYLQMTTSGSTMGTATSSPVNDDMPKDEQAMYYSAPITPIVKRTLSDDSLEKYRLGSGFYGRTTSTTKKLGGAPPEGARAKQPSWMIPASSRPVINNETDTTQQQDYSSDSESQFSYDNVGGPKKDQDESGLLGRSLSMDSADSSVYVNDNVEQDDELTLSLKDRHTGIVAESPTLMKHSPVHNYPSPNKTKGYNPDQTMSSYESADISPVKKSVLTKGLVLEDQDDESMPFDENREDSMEQDLDVFAAELEKIKRDMNDKKRRKETDDATKIASNVRN